MEKEQQNAVVMSAAQIEQSLLCCTHIEGRQCSTCPHRIYGSIDCKTILAADALVRIIRLEAEVRLARTKQS